jgi:hypothetical protein
VNGIRLTQHALQRLAQRGFAASDVDLIMTIGSEVPDGFLVKRKDCEVIEVAVKGLLDRIRRLEGKRLVVNDSHVVTAYHASPVQEHKLLRRDRKRSTPRRCSKKFGH